jgi:hypothetical protein
MSGRMGARDVAANTPDQGCALSLHTPEPWLDPVNGAELLDEIAATVGAIACVLARTFGREIA